MAKRKVPTLPAAREVAERVDVTTTALCDAHRHGLCPGKIVSATPAHGQACTCSCHDQGKAA